MAGAGGLAVIVGPANVERFQLMTSPMEENKRGKVPVTFNRNCGLRVTRHVGSKE